MTRAGSLDDRPWVVRLEDLEPAPPPLGQLEVFRLLRKLRRAVARGCYADDLDPPPQPGRAA